MTYLVDYSTKAEYSRYKAMRSRCHNPNNTHYANYGGRGIVLCDRWLNGAAGKSGFECFLEDMGQRPFKMTVERIDSNGPYSPENCRWASTREQHLNMRSNRRLEFDGRSLTVTEWEQEVGISRAAILRRLGRGWSVDRALTTAVDPRLSAIGRHAGLHSQHGNRFNIDEDAEAA